MLDYGLWSREDRDRRKQLAEDLGARWKLLYFEATDEVLRERLRRRNAREDANALRVTDRHFEEFMTRFNPPEGEGETVIPQT